jgi:hypothetical protein
MTCKEIEALLPALLEGALPADEAKRLEDHLMRCPSCGKALEDLKASGRMLGNLDEVEPPPWLKTRVMAQVREEAAQKTGILRKLFYPLYIKIPVQALATVLIAFVAWNVYKTGEPEYRQIAPPPAAVQEAPVARAPSDAVKAPQPAPVPPAMQKESGEQVGDREKKAFAPSASNAEKRAMRREPIVREEAKADAVRPAETAGAARPAAAPWKDEPVSKGAGAMKQPEMDQAVQAPARDQKLKAVQAPAGSIAKEAGKQEAAPARAAVPSATTPARPAVNMTLRVRDPGAAAAETADLLKRLGGQVVNRQNLEGRQTLSATIHSDKLEAFRAELKGLGKIQEKQAPYAPPEGELSIRIEILPE